MKLNHRISSVPSISTLVFIDAGLEDYQFLRNSVDIDASVFVLHPEVDGVEQITQIISQFKNTQDIQNIHIVSHGEPGKLYLGNTELSLDTLEQYSEDIKNWFDSASEDSVPVLNIYGCNVAATNIGNKLLERLHQLTQASIFASSTLVGNSDLGGNWELDVCFGKNILNNRISLFKSEALNNYAGVFTTGNDGKYTFYDSQEGIKGTASFNDISSTGDLLTVNRDQQKSVTLPFSFNFYGTNFNVGDERDDEKDDEIIVGENGGIAFVKSGTAQFRSNNANIPTANTRVASNAIFPFWDDLTGGQIHTKQDGDKFIIQWSNFSSNDVSGSNLTFQVVLHKDSNNIDFVYKDLVLADGASATIGLNGSNGSGLAYSVNQANLNGVTSIRFVTEPQLSVNNLIIEEGKTLTLSPNFLNATDVDNSDPNNITYTITNILNGEFKKGENEVTTFTQEDINNGNVQFVHNGTEDAPSFDISLSDSFNISNQQPAIVNFSTVNDKPVLSDSISEVDFNEDTLNASAAIINSNITLTDIDSSDFDRGNLTVTYSIGGGVEDQLTITNNNGITVTGRDIAYNGNIVANIDVINNGVNGNSLKVNFINTNANLAAVKALIQSLTYQNKSENPNPSRTISITVDDGDGAISDAITKEIKVFAENDAPVNTVPGQQNIKEDETFTFTGDNVISISDADAVENSVKVKLEATNGTLSLNGITGLNFTNSDGTDDVNIEIDGTISDINNALNGMIYKPNENYNGAASVKITTDDLGNSPSGAKNDIDVVNFNVQAVNDAPENTVPNQTQTVKEDSDIGLVFNTANNNLIKIEDVDADDSSGTGIVRVTLGVAKGSLTLSSTNGINFAQNSSNGTSSLIFTGKVADINRALDGLAYSGNLNQNGADTLNIRTEDLGNFGEGGDKIAESSINITIDAVNDPPVNTVPIAQSVDEDTDLIFSGNNQNKIKVGDVDVNQGTGLLEVTVSVSEGVLTLSDTTNINIVSNDGNGQPTITFFGNIDGINNALDGLKYRGNNNFNGTDILNITTKDNGNFGEGENLTDSKTVEITVNAANDGPINTFPQTQIVSEDNDLVFSDNNQNTISVSDIDAGEGTGNIKVILAVTQGKLTLGQTTGLTSIQGDKSNSITVEGNQSDINNALQGLTYRGNEDFNGEDTLTITTQDLGNTGTPGELTKKDTVKIQVSAVNDAPVNTIPQNQTVDEDTDLALTGDNAIKISDVDAEKGNNTVQVELSVGKGVLTLSNTENIIIDPENANGTSTVIFLASVANANIALDSLVYRGNLNVNGSDTVTVTTSDLGNTGTGGTLIDTDSFEIAINPVNDDPINTVPNEQTVNEDVQLVFSSETNNSITIKDVDVVEGDGRVEVKLSVENGTLTLSDTSDLTISPGDGVRDSEITFSGTVDKVNQALDGLIYQGNQNINSGANGDDTLTIITSDLGNTGSGNILTDTDTVKIKLDSVNDAPVNTIPQNKIAVDEDTDLAFTGDKLIKVSDIDVNEGNGDVEVTLTVTKGILTLQNITNLSFDVNNPNASSTVKFKGLIDDVNTALETLVYRGNTNANGLDTLTVTTSDLGNTGTGGILTDTDRFEITINPVNDDPVIAVPTEQNVNEDVRLIFSTTNQNAINVSDVDVNEGTGEVEVTLTVAKGRLTLGKTVGLIFSEGDGLGNGTMTFKGKIENVNQALDGLTYQGNQDLNSDDKGEDTLNIVTSDLGNTGKDNALTDTKAVKINLFAINDAPVNTVPSEQDVNEDTQLVFSNANQNAISISDIDVNEGTGELEVTLGVTKGVLSLSQVTGLTFSQGNGTENPSMTFKGSLEDINNALEGLVYLGNQDVNGEDVLTVTTNDLGNFGEGGALTKEDTVNIKINAVNDDPINSVPTEVQSVDEDTDLVFSSNNQNAIKVGDVDVNEGTGLLEVTVSVGQGILTLSDTTNINIVSNGGNGQSSITFSGNIDGINNALDGLKYRGNENFNGTDILNIATKDNGNFGEGGNLTDSKTVEITVNAVNDEPVNTVPQLQTVTEDSDLVFSDNNQNTISVSDVDAGEGTGNIKVTLAVTQGQLTLGQTTGLNLSVTGDNSNSITVEGNQGDINNALQGLTYRGNQNFNGDDTLTITTQDLGNTGTPGELIKEDSVQIKVESINDAPINTIPQIQIAVDEDTDLAFTGDKLIQVSDIDVGEGTGEVEVNLAVNKGVLTLQSAANLTFGDNNPNASANVTFKGQIADVNSALETLVYRGNLNANGSDTITVTTSDLGNTGAGGIKTDVDSFEITINPVNDDPVITVPTEQNVNEDVQLIFNEANQNTIIISDIDVNEGSGEVEVKLTVGKGNLTLSDTSGINFLEGNGLGNQTMTFSGNIDRVNQVIDGLSYQGNQDLNSDEEGEDTLTIVTRDLGNTGKGNTLTDTETVKIKLAAINDAPINTLPGEQIVDEDTDLVFSDAAQNTISVSDIDINDGSGELEVTLGVTQGLLTLKQTTGLTFSQGIGTTEATMTFKGTVANVNSALQGLIYRGNENVNGEDVLTITTNDLGNKGQGGALTKQDSVNIKINPVNDAPVNTILDTQTVDEDTDLIFSTDNQNTISVADVDVSEGTGELEVILSVTQGTLSLQQSEGLTFADDNVNGKPQIQLTGKVTDINQALQGLVYRGNENYNGSDTLTITTNDLGNTGSGGNQTTTDTIAITVNPVNDPPVTTDVPSEQSVNEDTSLVFSTQNQNAIAISDVDVDGDENQAVTAIQITLSVTQGEVSLQETTGLTFETGNENGSATVIFSGTVEDINKALDGLTYQGNQNFNGEDVLTIKVNDKSNGGSGGELFQEDTVKINVAAVNDEPVNTIPTLQTVLEDSDLVFNSENGNNISIDDIDIADGSGEVEVNLAVTQGVLTLAETTGLTFADGSSNNSSTINITGKIADINQALSGLKYRSKENYHGKDTLTITTNDKGNIGGDALSDSDIIDIVVTPVNDAPVNQVPEAQKVDENKQLIFSQEKGNAISVSDIDAGEGTGELEVTLSTNQGVLSLGNLDGLSFQTGDGEADSSITFSGKITDVNNALEGLTYQENDNFDGQDSLSITTSDKGNFDNDNTIESDTDTIEISVLPDRDLDGVIDSVEDKIKEEIINQNPNNNDLINLAEKAVEDAGIVALFADVAQTKPIIIGIDEEEQKRLAGDLQTDALIIKEVKTQSFTSVIGDAIAAFNSTDKKKSSLQKITAASDIINFEIATNPNITEADLKEKIKTGIKDKPVKVEIKLPDDVDVNTILRRKSDGTLYDFRRLVNPKRGQLEDDMLTGAVLQDRNLDGKADWAILYLQDGEWGDQDDLTNGEIGNSLIAANLDFGISKIEIRSNNDGLNFRGNRSYVQFSLDSFTGVEASEIGIARVTFTEDGQIATVNGKTVSTIEEAKQAIIQQGETLFSSLKKQDSNPDIGTQTRTLSFEEGEQAVFFTIESVTKDELLFNGLDSGSVKFSLPSLNGGAAIMTATRDENGQTANLSLSELFNISARVLSSEEVKSQVELLAIEQSQITTQTTDGLIDLHSSGAFDGKQVKMKFSVQREAANNNSAYFYRVDDANGSILDTVTGMLIDPTAELTEEKRQRYLELATTERLVKEAEFKASNLQTTEVDVNLAGGEYYASFLVSNGTIESINNDFSRVMTSYVGMNSDKVDHVRSLGNGKFGFEDIIGGGDRDYNDMIISIQQVEILA